jgi:ATP-binding cassette, subfamily F, member 3
MTVLQVAEVSFGYGASRLFEGVTFSVEAGERVALVAPNGGGKTTLLRLVTGELGPDAGSVVVRREVRVGYYRQSHEHTADGTVMEAFLSGFRDVLALRHALGQAQHGAASGKKEDLEQLARAADAYHLAHGDALER